MNTKHTTGKFSIYENAPGNKHRFLIHDSAGQTIATTTGDPDHAPDYYRALANARLIAAAPDLLAALILAEDRMAVVIENDTDSGQPEDTELVAAWQTALAAIAKATGETA